MLHAQDLLHGLSGLRFGHPVYLFAQIGSTNDEAKQLAEGGAAEGLLVVAEEQTAGRGRAGRSWITPPGTALAFSLVLRPPLPAERAVRLVMLAGLAACEALELVAGLHAVLKWPNDVLLSGKKVAGILVETALDGERLSYAVLGLGMNVSAAPPPEGVDFPATSVQAEAGHEIDRLRLLRAILARLEARYASLQDSGLHADWHARLGMMNERVVVRSTAGEHRGRAVGVDPEGALLLQLETGETLRLLAGDVHALRELE
jgi:BirA family biotin operon repressor/biotin-[acetyl-CoA-carboxylase] ligase